MDSVCQGGGECDGVSDDVVCDLFVVVTVVVEERVESVERDPDGVVVVDVFDLDLALESLILEVCIEYGVSECVMCYRHICVPYLVMG